MEDLRKEFPLVLTQDLVWSDMDAFKHVNNAVYFRFFENARIAYFEQVGLIAYKEETQIGPILASTSCNFRAPLTFPDTIQIGARIESIRPKTFQMKYAVYSENLERLAAEGEGLIVFYDYRLGESCEIPATIVSAINALQDEK
jgi:acyl-CoA thioester hydrolase